MMIFWKIKVNYVYLANFKLESGLRIRVTILDRRRRQRVKLGGLFSPTQALGDGLLWPSAHRKENK